MIHFPESSIDYSAWGNLRLILCYTILFQVLLSIILYLEIDSSHQRFALYIIIVQVLMAIWPVINIDSALNLLNTLQYFINEW